MELVYILIEQIDSNWPLNPERKLVLSLVFVSKTQLRCIFASNKHVKEAEQILLDLKRKIFKPVFFFAGRKLFLY